MKKIFTEEEFIERARLIEKVLFETYGYPVNELPISFNHNSGEYGAFYYRNGKANSITYTKDYLIGAYDLEEIDDTIAHELIHQMIYEHINKRETHGKIFQWYYKDFTGKDYIGRVKKSSKADVDLLVANYKHAFKCTDCGQLILRTRASRFTKNYKVYTCGICGGTFEKL